MRRIFWLALTASMTFIMLSCDEDGKTPLPNLAIGDFHEGGVIFYLDASGEHGLVCAIEDQSFEAEWGCPPSVIDGADGLAIGTGQQNTIDILSRCSNAGIAADLCDKLNSNGYTDWYLPSKDELNELYLILDDVNMSLTDNGGSPIENTEYWSSSHLNSNTAWIQSFNAGNQSGASEDDLNNVRAIRSF